MSEGHIQACFKALVATCTKRPLTCLEIDALLSIYTRDLTDIFAVPQCASRDSSGRIVFPFNNKLEYESLINGKRFIASAFSNGQHIIGYIYDIELSTLYGFDTVNADKRPELQTLAQQWRNQLKKCGVEGWIDVFHAPCTASLENWQCGYLVISMLHRCIRGLVGNNVDFLIQAELLDDKPSVYDLPWALPLRDWTDPDYHYSRHASLENVLEVVATTLMHELSVKAIPHDWYCKMDKRVSIGDVDWAKLTASDKYQKKIDYAATRTVLGGFVPISINGNWKVFDDAYRRVFPFDEGKKNTVVRMFRGLQDATRAWRFSASDNTQNDGMTIQDELFKGMTTTHRHIVSPYYIKGAMSAKVGQTTPISLPNDSEFATQTTAVGKAAPRLTMNSEHREAFDLDAKRDNSLTPMEKEKYRQMTLKYTDSGSYLRRKYADHDEEALILRKLQRQH